MACEGTASGEFCGGIHKETAYKIEDVVTGYVGCYADDRAARAMDANGKFVWEDMTNEVRESIRYGHTEDVVSNVHNQGSGTATLCADDGSGRSMLSHGE